MLHVVGHQPLQIWHKNFKIETGLRIGQIVFARVFRGEFIKTNELNKTERDEGGFGHSGI